MLERNQEATNINSNKMVRTRTLQLAAMYGGVIVLGTGIGLMEKVQYDMRHKDYYKKSVILLRGYKPAMDMLGEPLEVKRLDLAGRGPNKVDKVKGTAELVIPLKGSKDSGNLYLWSSQIKPTDTWEINKLEIEIDSIKGRWKFFEGHVGDMDEAIPDTKDAEDTDSEFLYLKPS